MANQREHRVYRTLTWRYCPSCGVEIKQTVPRHWLRDSWRKRFMDDHKLDLAEAERRIIDYAPGVASIAEEMPAAQPKRDRL